MATMYTCMVFALAELSSTIPTAGGGYGFARRALGPWGGFLTGTAILIEYAHRPGGHRRLHRRLRRVARVGISDGWPVYLACYAIFVGIHLCGVGEALKLMFVITAIAVVGAASSSWSAMVPEFDAVEPDRHPADGRGRGVSDFLPFGYVGIWAAFPYAIWFFLAVEGVPLAAEETRDPKRDMPRGLIAAMLVLLVFAALMLTLGAGRRRAPARSMDSGNPLVEALSTRRRRGSGVGRLRQLRRARRPGRQLLLDHLRLLAAAVRALPGRLPAARRCRSPAAARRRSSRCWCPAPSASSSSRHRRRARC